MGLGLTAMLLVVCARAVSAQLQFTDVSSVAGLSSEFYGSDSRHSLGVVWLDFDADGWPDLFATNGWGNTGLHLYRNLGDGGFESADQYLPALGDLEFVGARTADYDRDGDADLFIYTAHEDFDVAAPDNPPDGPANILLQNQRVENGGILVEPLFIDVAAAAGLDDCPAVPFGPDYDCHQTRTAAFLDYDVDGCVDLFVGHMVINQPGEIYNRDALYRNRCDGTFEEVTDAAGIQLTPNTWRATLGSLAADLNADGCPELYLGNVGSHPSVPIAAYNDVLLFNRCDGTFRELFEGHFDDSPAAMGIDIADLDRDGTFDIYVTDVTTHLYIDHDDGNSLYALRPGSGPTENIAVRVGVDAVFSWGTNFFDADQDGDEDLFVGTAGGLEDLSFLYERSELAFIDPGDVGLDTFNVRGSALADYDGDGDLDLAVNNQEGPLQLFRNDTLNQGPSLKVRVVQTHTNLDGFGVIADLTLAGVRYRRQLKGGTSTHSQDFDELHFGLGTETAEELRVRWPSGRVVVLTDVSPGVLTLVEPNDPPLAVDDEFRGGDDADLVVAAPGVIGNDSDPDGDSLSATVVIGAGNGTVVLDEDGSFTYTPNPGFVGTDSFTYRVSDGVADSNEATVTLTILPNDPPQAFDDSYGVDEDVELVVDLPGVLGNDIDPDGDPLSALLVDDVSSGVLELAGDGSFTYRPDPDFAGVDSFTYRARDDLESSNLATATIQVAPINDPPAAAPDSYDAIEDVDLPVAAPGVLANDVDADGDPMTATLVDDVANGTLALAADGSFLYTPAPNFAGTDSFTYRANDGVEPSEVTTVVITVASVNDPPEAVTDGYGASEDVELVVDAPGVLLNDSDADLDPLSALLVVDVSNGTLVLAADGSFRYTPAADFSGVDAFAYRASDGQAESNLAIVTIVVAATNDAPVGVDDAYSGPQDAPIVVAAPGVLSNDTDAEGDPLTAALVGDVSNGTLLLSGDGAFTYSPDVGFAGDDTFTYVANDGELDSAPTTVTLTILAAQ